MTRQAAGRPVKAPVRKRLYVARGGIRSGAGGQDSREPTVPLVPAALRSSGQFGAFRPFAIVPDGAAAGVAMSTMEIEPAGGTRMRITGSRSGDCVGPH